MVALNIDDYRNNRIGLFVDENLNGFVALTSDVEAGSEVFSSNLNALEVVIFNYAVSSVKFDTVDTGTVAGEVNEDVVVIETTHNNATDSLGRSVPSRSIIRVIISNFVFATTVYVVEDVLTVAGDVLDVVDLLTCSGSSKNEDKVVVGSLGAVCKFVKNGVSIRIVVSTNSY